MQDEEAKTKQSSKEEEAGVEKVDVFGMHIKGLKVDAGQVYALEKGTMTIKPGSVQTYLSKAFSSRLKDAEHGLMHLAEAFPREAIGGEAYRLYEQFRPSVPTGQVSCCSVSACRTPISGKCCIAGCMSSPDHGSCICHTR